MSWPKGYRKLVCKSGHDISDGIRSPDRGCPICFKLRSAAQVKARRCSKTQKVKHQAARMAWRIKYPEAHQRDILRGHLRRRYGKTVEWWLAQIKSQGGRCAICRRRFCNKRKFTKPCVDHKHSSNVVRGIICGQCNLFIGLADENTRVLKSAIAYLIEWRG